jgi:signal transduction histidine kinase
MRGAALIVCLAAACEPPGAHAGDGSRAMSQYIRDHWGSEKGFPGGPVNAIAQSADGYLWIGAEKGLVRFDGISFRLFESVGSMSGTGPTVLGVVPAPDGSVWARLRGPALVRSQNGAFTSVFGTIGLPDAVVTAMLRTDDRTILVATLGQGVFAYSGGGSTLVTATTAIPTSFVISMTQTADGTIWLGTRGAGLLRVQRGRVTRLTAGLPDAKVNCLLPDEDGTLWIGTDKGIVRWTGTEIASTGIPPSLGDVPALAMIRDAQANVWIAAGNRGLLRVNRHGVSQARDADELSDASVTTVFEDRERNIWVGTNKGIERWRDAIFTTYSTREGLPSDSVGPVYVDHAKRVWFAPVTGGLYWMRDGVVARVPGAGLDRDVIYSIAGAGGEVWLGTQRNGLTRLRVRNDAVTADRFDHRHGLAQDSVYAVHRARDGAVWAGTLSAGASRFQHGVFTTYDTASGLASNTVASIVETADGSMWFATPNGLSTLSKGSWRRYSTQDGLPSNDVNTLFEDSSGTLWIGTATGLARLQSGRLHTFAEGPRVLRGSVLGIAEDKNRGLWVATADRVARLDRDALVAGTLRAANVREFAVADGLMSTEGVKRHRTLAADSAGRIWLSLSRGLSVADPSRDDARALPALTRVESLSADGEPVETRDSLVVPPGRRRIALAYTGLSLSVPERVRFRYRLDGFDRDWSEPAAERLAMYTNLAPGHYVFRVTASNGEGLWNGAEAVMPFEIRPMIWQTIPFQAAAIGLCAIAGWGLYRFRVRQVARQLTSRFEERFAERTRIAQELHDTLLQGFVSASMQLHVAADVLPPDSAAKPSLNRVLALMGKVIEEGRNAVRGLRSISSAPHDLEEAFSGLHEELAMGAQAAYRVITEGRARALNPITRDEVYRIGREALVNAFRHSGARTIDVELDYASSGLRMLVRDDGCGIDPAIVQSGADGHWGLTGMRERAERIGASFKVRSRAAAGTEVELIVPGRVAFEKKARRQDQAEKQS